MVANLIAILGKPNTKMGFLSSFHYLAIVSWTLKVDLGVVFCAILIAQKYSDFLSPSVYAEVYKLPI